MHTIYEPTAVIQVPEWRTMKGKYFKKINQNMNCKGQGTSQILNLYHISLFIFNEKNVYAHF